MKVNDYISREEVISQLEYYLANFTDYKKALEETLDKVKQDVAFIEDKGLKSTIMYMISDNYKDRFIAEYKQLVIRAEKLRKALDNMDISFNSSVELLKAQLHYMDAYAGILRDRAKLEGIDLG